MAAQTTQLIQLAQVYGPAIVKQINRKTSALRVLPIKVGEGKNCAFVAESDGALAEDYSEGADATNFGSDGQKEAILSWSSMRSNAHITGLAQATSRTSHTPEGNKSLIASNIINSSSALASLVNQRIFAGSGTGTPKQLTGLGAAIGDDANTYATIDRTVGANAFWKPTVVDPGSLTAPTFSLLRDDLRKIYEKCGEVPDIAFVSPSVFNAVSGLYDSGRQYIQNIETARGAINLGEKMRGIELDGCIFIKDKDATANQIFYVNTNYVSIKVLPESDEAVPQLMPGDTLSGNDGFGALPLMFRYEGLAKTGDSKKFMCKVYAELEVSKPNACGVRKNVAA